MSSLLDKLSPYKFGVWTFAICTVAELLSYAAFYHPLIGWIALSIILLATLWLSLKDLRYGLMILLAELVIGSQGYLFSFGGQGSGISLRIGLWIIIMAIWIGTEIVSVLRGENIVKKYRELRYICPVLALMAVLILGGIIGLLYGNDFGYFFIEAKRWLYILVIIPFLISFRTKEDVSRLGALAIGGACFIALKTLVLVYIFSHFIDWWIYDLYGWLRNSLLGEVTSLPNGFYRVFIQSQIFLIPAGIFLFLSNDKAEKKKSLLLKAALVAIIAALTASLSRSFWLASGVSITVVAIAALIRFRPSLRACSRTIGGGLLAVVLGIGLVFLILVLPPEPKAHVDTSLLTDRATKMEAGAASRWSLLPAMWQEIEKSPVWGYGFGKTVTYKSSDPRITSSTVNGEYTTYAFEWGWFDIWLKLGLFGLAAYAWLLWLLVRDTWHIWPHNRVLGATALIGLIALAIVHFFTPYLNHPLGFGYLAVIACLLSCQFSKDVV